MNKEVIEVMTLCLAEFDNLKYCVGDNVTKRREVIKSTGLVAIWTTPVIKTVCLPSHAMTSAASDVVFIRRRINCDVDDRVTFTLYYIQAAFVFENESNMPLEITSLEMTFVLDDGSSLVTTNAEVTTSDPLDQFSEPSSNLPVTIGSASQFAVRWEFEVNEASQVSNCLGSNYSVTLTLQTSAGTVVVN